MASLQVKGIDDRLYEELKALAESQHRSISQEVIHVLKTHLTKAQHIQRGKTPAQVLLDLGGSWEDPRPAEEIVHDLRQALKSSRRLRKGLFKNPAALWMTLT
jgi:plasmid stability protein